MRKGSGIVEKLKPCPFCGGEAKQYNRAPHGWTIICKDCRGGLVYHKDRAMQVENWNKRA